ncbi:MAG: Rha family transcriptional regulator [Bacteroidales bacterium]|nr:Rha family transcriptional regulator [Bacteroidales bacterium]
MTNLMKTNTQRMTSLEIAELTGKNHYDLMRAIRKMEDAWSKINGCKFALVEYRDAKGELRPCYSLTKTECLYIATKFNDEARARLVLRWEQLEMERIQQGAVRHLLVSDEDVMDEAERIVGLQLTSCNRNADGCITTTDIAKSMGLETRDLNSFLVDRGIQKWQRGQFRLTPNYEGRGLAQDRLFIYYSKQGKQKQQTYLVWTPQGADFILKAMNNE